MPRGKLRAESTSDVDGLAHYEIVSGGEEITLTDAAGVEAFEAANTSPVGIVPSDGSDDVDWRSYSPAVH